MSVRVCSREISYLFIVSQSFTVSSEDGPRAEEYLFINFPELVFFLHLQTGHETEDVEVTKSKSR